MRFCYKLVFISFLKFFPACYSPEWRLIVYLIFKPRKLWHPLLGTCSSRGQLTLSPPRLSRDVLNITLWDQFQTTLLPEHGCLEGPQKLNKLASNQSALLGRETYRKLEHNNKEGAFAPKQHRKRLVSKVAKEMASFIKCFLCVPTGEHQVGPAGHEQHFASFSVPFHILQ